MINIIKNTLFHRASIKSAPKSNGKKSKANTRDHNLNPKDKKSLKKWKKTFNKENFLKAIAELKKEESQDIISTTFKACLKKIDKLTKSAFERKDNIKILWGKSYHFESMNAQGEKNMLVIQIIPNVQSISVTSVQTTVKEGDAIKTTVINYKDKVVLSYSSSTKESSERFFCNEIQCLKPVVMKDSTGTKPEFIHYTSKDSNELIYILDLTKMN